MLFKCPQCSKVIDMTLEELALSKKVVVCPQCLNEFLAQGVDIPASMLRTNVATTSKASKQIYCHNCGESLPVAGLKFCPYCGTSQNLTATVTTTSNNTNAPTDSQPQPQQQEQAQDTNKATGHSKHKNHEVKVETEDDDFHSISHLPLIRPLPHYRTKRQIMGSPFTRAICYLIIIILVAIFAFIIYLSYYDEDGSIARSIGLNM